MKYGNQVISSIRLGSQAIITKIAKGLTIVYEAWKTLIKRGKTPLTITNCQPDTTAIDYIIYGGNDCESILPNEYQQVEYIQTTGTQYIDSGVPLKNKLKTIVDWIYEDTSGSNSYTGGHIGSPGNRWLIGSQRQNKQYFFAVGTGNTTTGVQFGNRDVVEAYWADRASYIKINGVQSTFTFDHLVLGEEPNYTFYISAVNRDGNASSRSKLTIYNWKFYQDDILIRDFIPCYRKSDRVAGLYDVVTGEFYTNDGTGEFIVGEPTFPSPTPDAPIEMKGVGDKSTNILNPDFSKTNTGTYSYILLNDAPKVLTLRLIDRDTSVDISNVSFGFTGNGTNANNGFHWCVAGGGVRDKFITNNTGNDDNPIENPLMYFSVYPKGQATWEAVFKRFDIQIVEGEYAEATIPEYEPFWDGCKIQIKIEREVLPVGDEVKNLETAVYLDQPINKVGTCMDSLSYKTQSVTKSVGYYQFDGTENWEEHTVGQECKVYRLDGVLTPKVGAFVSDTYMTHFALTYIYTTAELTPGLYRFASSNPVSVISSSGRLYVSSTCQTVEEFKEWLSVNKPSIYYPLAENETINIELPALYLPDETNIITVDTEVSPSEIEITYTGRE